MAFWRIYYHLVWATKERQPLITPEVEIVLYPYLTKKAAEFEAIVFAVNGWNDHVHLVLSIPPKHAISEVVKHFKGASSHHLNYDIGDPVIAEHFAWQRGYGVFSLGETQRPWVEEYVQKQKEHHQQSTTNRWLERIEEDDDGPVTVGVDKPGRIAESRPEYFLLGDELPF